MKFRKLTAFTIGASALSLLAVLSVPAFIVNTTAPAFSASDKITIKGSVNYLQRMALPPHAYLVVQLVDVTKADGPFPVVAEMSAEASGAVPINFDLPVRNNTLKTNHKYALQARISVGDVLWFVSDKRTPINVAHKNTRYEIILGTVSQSAATKEVPMVIIGKEWHVEDIFNKGVIDNSRMTITIEANNDKKEPNPLPKLRVTGSGGCNRYSTSVVIDEQQKTIDFAPPAMTFMACAEALSQQENRFIEMLEKTKSYNFDDVGRLILKDSDGNYIARLTPDL